MRRIFLYFAVAVVLSLHSLAVLWALALDAAAAPFGAMLPPTELGDGVRTVVLMHHKRLPELEATLRRRPCAPEFRGRPQIKMSRSPPVDYLYGSTTLLYSTFCLINTHICVKTSDSFLFCKLQVCTLRVMLPKAPRICARVRRENREGVAWTRTAPRHSNSLLLMSINNTHQRACHCAPARSNALSDTA